jgi:hypothetical protein
MTVRQMAAHLANLENQDDIVEVPDFDCYGNYCGTIEFDSAQHIKHTGERVVVIGGPVD